MQRGQFMGGGEGGGRGNQVVKNYPHGIWTAPNVFCYIISFVQSHLFWIVE